MHCLKSSVGALLKNSVGALLEEFFWCTVLRVLLVQCFKSSVGAHCLKSSVFSLLQ